MGEEYAAKFLSATEHEGFVVDGAHDVYVEGVWGAHLSAPTICPVPTPTPHGAGKVRLGTGAALTVTLHKYPGAVVGSKVQCAGAPAESNAVSTGAGTVKYGVTSSLNGYPVVEGDGYIRVGNVVISGEDDFNVKVLGDLATMLSNDPGRALFDRLQDSQYPVHIEKGDATGGYIDFDKSDPNASNGKGTEAVVKYDPDASERNPTDSNPSDATLFHELSHADHVTHGTYEPGHAGDPDEPHDEHNVLFGSGGGPGENDYRRARGLPIRPNYKDPT